jgi:hypothetical protein
VTPSINNSDKIKLRILTERCVKVLGASDPIENV